jgi:acyl dehydratase
MSKRYWEDFRAGDTWQFGSHRFTREEIVTFARQYDPQPFHTDEAAARESIYGGLIASGWQTASTCFRLAVDGLIGGVASMGSPGVDELRWLRPVRPGDSITVRAEVLETHPSQSKSDRGTVRLRYEATNQRGEVVLTMTGVGIFGRRPAGLSSSPASVSS